MKLRSPENIANSHSDSSEAAEVSNFAGTANNVCVPETAEALKAELEAVKHRLHFLETLVDELPTPIFAKDKHARYCVFNKAYEKFFGVRREDLLDRTVMDLDYLELEDRRKYNDEDLNAIKHSTVVHYETVFTVEGKTRTVLYWSKGFVEPVSGEKGLVGEIVDISIQKALEEELARSVEKLKGMQQELLLLSRTDELTGLYNRRYFDEILQGIIRISNRYKLPFSLIMADIDHFKQVNDCFGHDQGDVVLKSFADILRSSCRSGDYVTRFGGEEFVLLLPMTVKSDARSLAERIRIKTSESCELPDGRHLTVSLGVTEFIYGEAPELTIKRVDNALYTAKENGRNQVVED